MLFPFLLTLFLYIAKGQSPVTYRNWPVWGHDNQHSRFQSQNFTGSLCGIQAQDQSFPTTARQSFVQDGVLYYCRTSSGNIVAVDLTTTTNNRGFNIRDIVRAVLPGATSSNLTSPVLMGLMHDDVAETGYIVGSFTAKLVNVSGHVGVLFVVNSTSGEVLANVSATGLSEPLSSLVLHPIRKYAILGFETHLDAVTLPIYNGTVDALSSEYHILWSIPVNGTDSVPALLPGGTGFIALHSGNSLSVLDPNNGQPVNSVPVANSGPLVFATSNFIALTSAVVEYPSMKLTPLSQYRLLALAPNDAIVAYEVASTKVVKLDSTQNFMPIWRSQPINSNSVAASVDVTGLIYVQSSRTTSSFFALDLTTGVQYWSWDHPSPSAPSSPIIASSGNSTYILLDGLVKGVATQQLYTPSCNGGDCKDNQFVCKCGFGFFGPSCSIQCVWNTTCNENGKCDGQGNCVCAENWYGPRCDHFCLAKSGTNLTQTCFNGTCATDGTCACFPGFQGDYCNCDPKACLNNGTCRPTGKCACTGGGMFTPYVPGGEFCDTVLNLSFVAVMIGLVGLVGMCAGIATCCICNKVRKGEKAQFSLLPTSEAQKH